jgi:hypothetical protein
MKSCGVGAGSLSSITTSAFVGPGFSMSSALRIHDDGRDVSFVLVSVIEEYP